MPDKKKEKNGKDFVASAPVSSEMKKCLGGAKKKKHRGGYRPDRRKMTTGGMKIQVGGPRNLVLRDDD